MIANKKEQVMHTTSASNVRRGSGRPNLDRAAISVTIRRATRDRLKLEENASRTVDTALQAYYSMLDATASTRSDS